MLSGPRAGNIDVGLESSAAAVSVAETALGASKFFIDPSPEMDRQIAVLPPREL